MAFKPALFTKLPPATYVTEIKKEVKDGAKAKYRGNYFIAQNAALGAKKQTVLLFVGEKDPKWKDTIEKIKADAKKTASGECQLVTQPSFNGIVIKSAKGLGASAVVKLLNDDLFKSVGDIKAMEVKEFAELIAKASYDKAGKEFVFDAGAKKALLKANLEVGEYDKFAKAYHAFVAKYDLKYDGGDIKKVPVNIWSSLLLGLLKKGKFMDKVQKSDDTNRLILRYKDKEGKPVRDEMLQEAMNGLKTFVGHASRNLDKVVKELTKGGSKKMWSFWSGTGAQDLARRNNSGGMVLEGAVGSWFDNVWNFESLTGMGNFQLWTAMSEMYAQKAAENFEKFNFNGFVGPGATTEQNVFNQIESPTFVEILKTKQKVAAPKITWFVVHCVKNGSDRWELDVKTNNGVAGEFDDRGKALAKVKELYGG